MNEDKFVCKCNFVEAFNMIVSGKIDYAEYKNKETEDEYQIFSKDNEVIVYTKNSEMICPLEDKVSCYKKSIK